MATGQHQMPQPVAATADEHLGGAQNILLLDVGQSLIENIMTESKQEFKCRIRKSILSTREL